MTEQKRLLLSKARAILRYIESRPIDKRTPKEERFLHLHFCCNDWCDAPEWSELELAVKNWKF